MAYQPDIKEVIYTDLEIPPLTQILRVRLPLSCKNSILRPFNIPPSVTELDIADPAISTIPEGVVGPNVKALKLFRLNSSMVIPKTLDLFLENIPIQTEYLTGFNNIFVRYQSPMLVDGIGRHWVYDPSYGNIIDLPDDTHTTTQITEHKIFGQVLHIAKREPLPERAGQKIRMLDVPQPLTLSKELINEWIEQSEKNRAARVETDVDSVMADFIATLKKATCLGLLHNKFKTEIEITCPTNVETIIGSLRDRIPIDNIGILDTSRMVNGSYRKYILIQTKEYNLADTSCANISSMYL